MAYPTDAQINAAVPAAGTPSRALTNAVLKSLRDALPTGNAREVAVFNGTTGEIESGPLTADMWSDFPDGAPTTGLWLAAFIPAAPELLGFAQAGVFPEDNTVPVRTVENGPFTGGRLKASPAMDPEDCVTLAQALVRTIAAPTAADSEGVRGEFFVDTDYLYICTALNTWVRFATTAW